MARYNNHDFDYFTSTCTKCGLERRFPQRKNNSVKNLVVFASNGKNGLGYEYKEKDSNEWNTKAPKCFSAKT